jgi:hypothetical protein
MTKHSLVPPLLAASLMVTMASAGADPVLLPIEAPGPPAAPGDRPVFLPFPAPLADPDLSKIPAPPVGAKMVSLGLGRVLAMGPKGNLIMELRPVDPPPPDLAIGAPKVELRPDAHRAPSPDYVVFLQTGQRSDDPFTKLVVFLKVFASVDGRLAACGFYLREPTRPDGGSSDRFVDPRSYIQIGSRARLPTIFLADATSKYIGDVPGPIETILERSQDSERIRATCITSNVAWDAAYATQPLSLHLQFPALRYQYTTKQSYARP